MRAATKTTSDRTTSDNQSMAAQLMAGIVGSPSDCSARTTLERTGGFRGGDHDQLSELILRSSSDEDQFATERQNWCARPRTSVMCECACGGGSLDLVAKGLPPAPRPRVAPPAAPGSPFGRNPPPRAGAPVMGFRTPEPSDGRRDYVAAVVRTQA